MSHADGASPSAPARPGAAPAAGDEALGFSLVRGDLLFRLQRAIGLIPADGLGIGRRIVFFVLVAYVPIAVWAAVAGRMLPGVAAEPLLQHFGVHVRFLVAIPLFILAEGLAHARTTVTLPYFVRSGLVTESDLPRFRDTVRGVARLRDASLPWVVIASVVAAWTVFGTVHQTHEVEWAVAPGPTRLGFGGWWFLYVARPIYIAFALAWLWRLVLLTVLLVRIARLDLALVPTHPDRVGGLGFLERLPAAFQPVVLGASAVVSSAWAHQVLYHDVSLQALRAPMVASVLLMLVVVLAPLVALAPTLIAARRRALLEYGALVGEHGRLVRRRWVLGERLPDDGILAAPEIGPVADTLALYGAVRDMRGVPVGKPALLAVVVPALIPILCVVAIRIPVRTLLLGVLKALA